MTRPNSRCITMIKIGTLGLAIAAYFFFPGIREFAAEGLFYLKCRNFEGLRQFILSYGIWAPVTSIMLMTLQSLVPLVPGAIITISNAWIFGWQYGALYSWTGALLGAALDFGIARWYGRPVIEKLVNTKYLNYTDVFFRRHGILAVFITRLVPVVPFKVISYGSGLTQITVYKFLTATAIGQTPPIIIYSILGQNLSHNFKAVVAITSVFIILGLIVYYYHNSIERYFTSRKKK
ncbi:MAG: ydjZ [Firmicutes bacterium]|nr:ydjZ [Bacillota bacterium]